MNRYPADWLLIATRIKEQANWRCERCGHPHDVKTWHILTVHHLDGDPTNCSAWNLAALCQRCHLSIQNRVVMGQMFMQDMMPVADWFKPHLEGYLKHVEANSAELPSGQIDSP